MRDTIAGHDGSARPGLAAYYVLALLMGACFLSFADRFLLTLLAPAIQNDLGISDTQLSLLQGLSFSIFYSVLAMPFGWVADNSNRRNLVAAGVATWCVATVMSGFCHTFPQLLAARSAVAIGEATLMPAAFSMLADTFPSNQRGRVFGYFTSASAVGTGGALVLGGMVLQALHGVQWVSLGPLGTVRPWQAAFVLVGSPGLLVAALLFFTIREPGRRPPEAGVKAAGDKGPSILGYIRTHPLLFFCILGAYSTYTSVSYATLSWAPTLMHRKFAVPLSLVGLSIGACVLTTGVVGTIGGGWLADYWTGKRAIGGKFRAPLFWSLLIVPVVWGFALSPVFGLGVAFFAVFVMLQNGVYASGAAVMQDVVPPLLVGRATAIWYLVTGVIGQATGPTLVALLDDYVFKSRAALPYSLALVVVPGAIATFFLARLGLRLVDEAKARRAAAAAA